MKLIELIFALIVLAFLVTIAVHSCDTPRTKYGLINAISGPPVLPQLKGLKITTGTTEHEIIILNNNPHSVRIEYYFKDESGGYDSGAFDLYDLRNVEAGQTVTFRIERAKCLQHQFITYKVGEDKPMYCFVTQ